MSRSSGPRRLGLDAPETRICEDRGESDYMKNHPIPSSFKLLPDVSDHSGCDHDNSIFTIIKCELDKTQVYYPRNSNSKFYIPRDKLRCILTRDRIIQVINELKCCSHLSQGPRRDLLNRILSQEKGHPPCWKLLAVLIRIGKQEELLKLVYDQGVTDHCLPFKVTGDDGSQAPVCCCIEGHNHPTINGWPEKCGRKASIWSYAVKAIYLTSASGRHNHYVLETNDVLPITKVLENVGSPDAPAAHQNEPRVIESGYSEVLIITLDESHHDFSDIGSWDHDRGPRQFALKKLHSTNGETFDTELTALLRARRYFSEHLIKVVATFEIQHSEGTTYHFLFPCALGDLWFFWKEHSQQDDRIPRAPWMARQLHGLAEALRLFHNEQDRSRRLRSGDHPDNNTTDPNNHGVVLYGRHGDVKAENLLWFAEKHPDGRNTIDWLVLTDFGLGCLNSMYSRSGVDPTGVSRTATYRSPEFDLRTGKLARVSDVFSFGCMCLEFVTWYLMGWEAVSEGFVQARMETDPTYGSQFQVDTFFSILRESQENGNGNTHRGEERAIIKPKVTEWIERLRASEHSSCYTLQLLDLIEKEMLEPDPGKRIRSDALVKKLRVLADTCEKTKTFYLERRNGSL